jgi:hypothetical protein
MEIVSLLLSRAEIRGKKPGFLKPAFDSKLGKPAELMSGKDLVQAALTGGCPEMLASIFQDPEYRIWNPTAQKLPELMLSRNKRNTTSD